jgi:hypothetical protein
VSLVDVVAAGVTERANRQDISRWQKAQEMLEFQRYLQTVKRPHSTRDLARLTGVAQSTVAEQLTIATALSASVLAQHGIRPEALAHVPHRTLLQIAKLPPYLRTKPLRDILKGGAGTATPDMLVARQGRMTVRESRRAAHYQRMREEGQFLLEVPKPMAELSHKEANEYLDELLPALANLAQVVLGTNRSHYIGLTGNGGILVYLAPQT